MDEHSKRMASHHQCSVGTKLKVLLLVISTNLASIYLFASPSLPFKWPPAFTAPDPAAILIRELNSTQEKLSKSEAQLADLSRRLATSNSLLETLLTELGRLQGNTTSTREEEGADGWQEELSGELKLAVGPHKLPLGRSPNIGSDEIYLPLGSACRRLQDEVIQYMAYDVGGECPVDDVFAQRLMLKGCEPLPRRRCHPKSPVGYVEPRPLPESLWAMPSDTSVVWEPYTCKNYDCLVRRAKDDPRSYDCKDCFDLGGREKNRWLVDTPSINYGIDAVLGIKPPGTIRIGLDLGGGSGTFAARMKERNITIVTSTMNLDGPFNSFVASRGLVPLHISISHRLPFFENTLDIVHSMHVLSNWIPDVVLEFALYDIYRVLRPGGLFWLDHFFCVGEQMNKTYAPMFDRIGFRKVRWNSGRKLDRGIERNEWYLSALLEKPMA